MKIVDSEYDLLPQVLGLDLCHLPIGLSFEVSVKGAAIDVLHDEEDLLVRFKCLKELRQALVIDLLHDLDLSLHALPSVWLKQFELFINLHRYLLIEHLVEADPHHRVGTLAYTLTNNIVVNVFNMTALSAELVLLTLLVLGAVYYIRSILIFLHVICKGMRLRQMRCLVLIHLLLHYMVVHKVLASTQLVLITRFLLILISISLLSVLRRRGIVVGELLAIRVDDSAGLPCLELSVMVLNVLGGHDLRLALSVGELVGLWSSLSPIVDVACFEHAILVGVATVLVVGALGLCAVDQVRLARRLHLNI